MDICPVDRDLSAYLAEQARAEAQDEAIEDCIDDAIYALLAGEHYCWTLEDILAHEPRSFRAKRPTYAELIDAAGQPTAACVTFDDWFRLLHLAPLESIPHIVQCYRDWARDIWADKPHVLRLAEEIARGDPDDLEVPRD